MMGYQLVDIYDNVVEDHVAELIHSQSNYPIEKISNCKTIGISSGASAPEILVKEFINNIKNKFTVEIEEVEIVKENITFKIPGKLN